MVKSLPQHALELSEKATPAPWNKKHEDLVYTEDNAYSHSWVETTNDQWIGYGNNSTTEVCQQMDDAQFIAEARTLVPLLAERLALAIEALKMEQGEFMRTFGSCQDLARLLEKMPE